MLAADREYQAARERLTLAAHRQVGTIWREIGDDFDRGWPVIAPAIVATITDAQEGAAADGLAYFDAAMSEQGITPKQALIDPAAFAGSAYTLDGLALGDLSALTYGAVVRARSLPATSLAERIDAGSKWLGTITQTQLAHAGRASMSTKMTADAQAGWTRTVNPPCCRFCGVRAGTFHAWNYPFWQHPGCFPAGTVVSGPPHLAATRRWYQGELTTIRTASGKKLTATGNHPILTDQGWVPATLLHEGAYVLSSAGANGAVPLTVPDEGQTPTLIEDLWRAGDMATLSKVPTSAEDFHGDGGHGEVDVVLTDRLLRDGAHVGQQFGQHLLTSRVVPTPGFTRQGALDELLMRVAGAPDGIVGSLGLSSAIRRRHLGGAHFSRVGPSANLHASIKQALANDRAADRESLTERILTLPGEIGVDDFTVREDMEGSRWDAPAGPMTVDNRGAYASRGRDLVERLTSEVTLDRVVDVERVSWSGHVYNLTSVEGWYEADGLIVSNCDCTRTPTTLDRLGDTATDIGPDDITGLSMEQREAIRDGADIAQVINSDRGRSRDGLTTTEGTTRRGFGYHALGKDPRNDVRIKGERNFRTTRARLTPDGIYAIAKDREEAITLLRQHGYIYL